MKLWRFLPLLLVATLSACRTALIYTGNIPGEIAAQREQIANELEAFYISQGFVPFVLLKPKLYERAWSLSKNGHLILWLGHTLKNGRFEIRLVPQPGANQTAQAMAGHIRDFMGKKFPGHEFVLEEHQQWDLFR